MFHPLRPRQFFKALTKGLLTAALCAGVLTGQAHAIEQTTPAKQAVIVDYDTGNILLEKNGDQHMPTSSMSKVITMYMVFEAIKSGRLSLTDELPVSEKAWRMEGSKMFIEVGKRIKVEDLIKGVLVQSGNDACIVFAEALAATEENFADALNRKAQELGMKSSHFMNASGWPDENHYSTARDLAILARRMIHDFPEYYPYFSIKEFTYNNIKQANRNPLLYRNIGVDGMKTGHTEVAGYGLIASGTRDGRRTIVVVNGLADEKMRAEEGARLMEWSLAAFENITYFKSGQKVADIPVKLGSEQSVSLVLKDDVFITIPKMDKTGIKAEAIFDAPLKAPVPEGVEVGKLVVTVPGRPLYSYPLYSGASVAEAAFIPRTLEKLILMVGNKS